MRDTTRRDPIWDMMCWVDGCVEVPRYFVWTAKHPAPVRTCPNHLRQFVDTHDLPGYLTDGDHWAEFSAAEDA